MAPTQSFASDSGAASSRPVSAGSRQPLSALTIDRVLPNSMDAEIGVLGSMLLSPQEAGVQARERLAAENFYYAAHQVIFRELGVMQDAMQAVDLITLTQRLQDKGVLEDVGGPAYLTDLINRVPTATNIEQYVEIVWEKYLLRQLIGASHDVITRSTLNRFAPSNWISLIDAFPCT